MVEISKSFPGVQALDRVNFTVEQGQVHALVGENGAGKSTLMKILAGVYQKESGHIFLHGRPVEIRSPRAAQLMGISVIHQELLLVPNLSVARNIFLGHLPVNGVIRLVDEKEMNRRAAELLQTLQIDIDPTERVGNLSVAKRQMVEIAKALSYQAEIVVMDEPTAALTEAEVRTLFRIIRSLKAQGVSVIYISHRLGEIFEICDHVTVLRDGRLVKSAPVAELNHNLLVSHMVGRAVEEYQPRAVSLVEQPDVLTVRGISRERAFADVSFSLRQGEILGFAGLMGAGRSEVAAALFGLIPLDTGLIEVKNAPVRLRGPEDAIRHGIAFVTSDRKEQGLVLGMSVVENSTLTVIDRMSRRGLINMRKRNELAQSYVELLEIRTPGLGQKVLFLSGGNQQKVVLSKWLATMPRILILDEPTRGVDVGAKAEIHQLLRRFADNGMGVIVISSEMPELLAVSDRIIVMFEGRITGEFSREEVTEEKINYSAHGLIATGD